MRPIASGIAVLCAALGACEPPRPVRRAPQRFVAPAPSPPTATPARADATLAAVDGIALAPQQWRDGVIFTVQAAGYSVGLYRADGLQERWAGLGDGRLAGAVAAAMDGSWMALPLESPDGRRRIASWTGEHRPTTEIGEGSMPAICPDGSVIAVATRAAGRLRSLWRFDPSGDPTPIVAPRAGRALSWPRVSPDGRFVAYVDAPGGPPATDAPAALAVMALAGGSPRILVPDEMRVGPPGWSADGSRILFSVRTADSPGRDLYAIAPGGGTPERLTDDENDEDFPSAWFGDDALLYVSSRRLPIDAEVGPVEGATRDRLPPLPPEAVGPSPSRDGSLLLWVVPAGPAAGVWLRPAHGDTPWAVFRGPTAPTPPAFLSDGRHVVYLAPTPEGIDLFVISVDGGEPVRISHDGLARTDAPPAPSPGGSEVAWMIDDGSRAVVVASIGGGARRLVARDVRAFSWDPSGAFLLVRDDEGLPLLSVFRDGSETVLPGLADSTWRPVRLMDDGRAVLVLERGEHARLLQVRASDGRATTVLDLPPDVDAARASVAVDPTGRWVLEMLARARTEVRVRRGPERAESRRVGLRR